MANGHGPANDRLADEDIGPRKFGSVELVKWTWRQQTQQLHKGVLHMGIGRHSGWRLGFACHVGGVLH